MGKILYFYNPCATCGNDELRLVEDTDHKLSIAGGIRLICVKCGRNTKPEVWNDFNGTTQPTEPINPEPIAI